MFYRAAASRYWLLAIANRMTYLRKSTFCFIFVASQKEVAPSGRKLLDRFFDPPTGGFLFCSSDSFYFL